MKHRLLSYIRSFLALACLISCCANQDIAAASKRRASTAQKAAPKKIVISKKAAAAKKAAAQAVVDPQAPEPVAPEPTPSHTEPTHLPEPPLHAEPPVHHEVPLHEEHHAVTPEPIHHEGTVEHGASTEHEKAGGHEATTHEEHEKKEEAAEHHAWPTPGEMLSHAGTEIAKSTVDKGVEAAFAFEDFGDFNPEYNKEDTTTDTPIPAPANENIGLPVDAPFFGRLVLMPFEDKEKGLKGYQIKFASKDKKVTIGNMVIDDATVSLINKKLGITGHATIFGQEATFGLKGASFGKLTEGEHFITKAVLGVTFIDKPTIEFIPGKKMTLLTADVILQREKPVVIKSEAIILGHNATVGFMFTRSHINGYVKLPDTPLIELIPRVHNTFLEKGILKKGRAALNNIWARNREERPLKMIIKGSIDLTESPPVVAEDTSSASSSEQQPDAAASQEHSGEQSAPTQEPTHHSSTEQSEHESSLQHHVDAHESKAKELAASEETAQDIENLKNIDFKATIDRTGVMATMNATSLYIPHIGDVKPATITIDTTQTPAKIELTGGLDYDVSTLGQLHINVHSAITTGGIHFEGSVSKEVSYANFAVKNITVGYNSEEHAVMLKGIITTHDIDLLTSLTLKPDPDHPGKKAVLFKAHGKYPEVAPFASTNIPGLNTFKITNFDAGIVYKRQGNFTLAQLFLNGKFHFMGYALNSVVQFVQNESGQRGIYINAPIKESEDGEGTKLSEAIPFLKGPIFDGITVKHAAFVASSIDFHDPDTNEDIQKGLSFTAKVPLTGTLEKAGKLIGSKNQDFTMYGKILPANPRLSEFGIKLTEGDTNKTAKFSLGAIEVAVTGEPSFNVEADVFFRPNPKEVFEFAGKFMFTETTANLEARMDGIWKDPFFLAGWQLANPAIRLGMLYGSPGIPTEIGGTGELKIKDKLDLNIAFLVDATLKDIAFEGRTNQLVSWHDLVELAIENLTRQAAAAAGVGGIAEKAIAARQGGTVGAVKTVARALNLPGVSQLEKLGLPTIKVHDLYVKYAAKDTKIGSHIIEQGIAAEGKIDILGKTAEIIMHASTAGIKAYGGLDPIDLGGVLKVTGRGEKQKPEIDIEVSLDRQKFLITGIGNLADILIAEILFEIKRQGIEFKMEGNFGGDRVQYEGHPLLYAKVDAQATGSFMSPEFTVEIVFQQYLKKYLFDQISKGFDEAKRVVERDLTTAQKEIDKINSVVKDADEKIKDARDKVANAKRALDAIDTAIADTQKAFKKAQSDVDSIKRQISELDTWYNGLPAY
jgi:hypothetical protein